MIDIKEIKEATLEGIALKPTHITLERYIEVSNGMKGYRKEKVNVGEFDIFIDDASRPGSTNFAYKDNGEVITVRSINMLIVIDSLLIGDFFILNNNKYEVTYPGELVPGVYNADIRMVGETNG